MNCCNNYPFLGESSCSRQYTAKYGCRPHLPYVKANFIIPAVNTEIQIEVTDSQSLYKGQGIMIHTGFYQITEIVDATNIKVEHNGIGVTADTTMYAVHPTNGCYQYPVVPCGEVALQETVTPVGLNAAANATVASSITNVTKAQMLVSYPGPGKCRIMIEVNCDIANAPNWVAIPLPEDLTAATGAPKPVFSASLDNGSGLVPAVGSVGVSSYANHVIIGIDAATALANGTTRKFFINGVFEYDV